MRHFLACVLSLVCLTASADIVAPTRTTAYDWQCTDAAGAKISDHQRVELAMVACLNNPAGAYIQGGRYRVNRVVVTAGTATLSWVPPTQCTDGSAISNCAVTAYRIVYGRAATELTQAVQISAPASGHVLTGLPSGAWFFAVIAVAANSESAKSNVSTKTIG